MNIIVSSKLVIPANEIKFRFSRSSGPGGQNVNKTDSRVEIVFDVLKSRVLSSDQKLRINDRFKRKLVNGCICIAVQEKRTQLQNRNLAAYKLASSLRNLLKQPTAKRKKTKPSRSSQNKRLESKKRRGELKKNRQSRIDS